MKKAVTTHDFASLNELARELGINKSTLAFYVSKGLLKPTATVGGMQIFNREETIVLFQKIKKHQDKGKTINEIRNAI